MQNGQQAAEMNGDGAQVPSVEMVDFDFSNWRKQGAQALEFLRRRKSVLENELHAVDRDLDELEGALGERTNALAEDVEPKKSSAKVMIRKTIKSVLMADTSDDGIKEETLIDHVLARKSGSTAVSIRISAQKLCKENPQFVFHEGSYYFETNVDEIPEFPVGQVAEETDVA